MDIFQQAFMGGVSLGGCRYFPRGEKEKAYNELVLFMGRSKKELNLVTGELNPEFYERDWPICTWENLLDKGVQISAVLSDNAIRELGKESGFMERHERIQALKEEYPDNLHIYLAPERPLAHYGIVDGKHVFFEDVHEPHDERNVYFQYKSEKFASQLGQMFYRLVSGLPERDHSPRS